MGNPKINWFWAYLWHVCFTWHQQNQNSSQHGSSRFRPSQMCPETAITTSKPCCSVSSSATRWGLPAVLPGQTTMVHPVLVGLACWTGSKAGPSVHIQYWPWETKHCYTLFNPSLSGSAKSCMPHQIVSTTCSTGFGWPLQSRVSAWDPPLEQDIPPSRAHTWEHTYVNKHMRPHMRAQQWKTSYMRAYSEHINLNNSKHNGEANVKPTISEFNRRAGW